MAADACETPSTDARAADAQRSPTASTDVRSQSSPARGHLSPTADQPEAQSPRYAAKPQSPQAKKEWLNSLNSQVSGGRALRASLRTAASSRLPKAKGMDLKLLGSVERALEDKLKVRSATEKTLMATLARREHYMNQTGYRVEQCLLALRKTGGEAWCHLNMTEKRLELRGQMPEQEQLQDELQEALEQEKVDLQKVHKKLASKMAEADKCWNLVLSSKEEMLRRRLTLPYIRSSEPFEFLDMMKAREDELEAKCVVFESFLRDMEGAMSRFGRKTGAATRTVLSRLVDARRTLEVEIHMNRASVAAAEHRLNKLRKRIRRYYSMPENSELVEGDDNFSHCMDSLSKVLEQEDALFSPESLEILRNKIKAASYTGHSGRELNVVFDRFDRDGSGGLDEDELRRVLRRTFRIPPSLVTDPEISALFMCLDIDKSGAVSKEELVEFLRGDQAEMNDLETRFKETKNVLARMRAHQSELLADFQRKTTAWQLCKSIENVNRVNAMELEKEPPPLDPDSDKPLASARRQKPLEPRMAEKVRARMKKAADSVCKGRPLDIFFAQLDKDGSGQLDVVELRRAVRDVLKIAEYVVSDSDVSSLFVMLDKDKSGTLDIKELSKFVEPKESSASTPTPRAESRLSRQQAPRLSPVGVEKARQKVQDNVQAHCAGRDLATALGGSDGDTGRLEEESLIKLFRRTLRMGSSSMPDEEIAGLFATLDEDNSGSIGVAKLIEFIDLPESPARSRGADSAGLNSARGR